MSLLSPSGRIAPRPFAVAIVLVYLASYASQALLSVDVAAPDGRVAVVEVRAFPWLRGVPDAELRLADFVYASAFRLPVAGARARASLP